MKSFLLVVFGLLLLTTSCSSDALELDKDSPTKLINHWVKSYEEGDGIYRPANYKIFAESRYRLTYKFMKNKECEYLVLSPIDAHFVESGFWEHDRIENIVKIYDSNIQFHKLLVVGSVSAELLQIVE